MVCGQKLDAPVFEGPVDTPSSVMMFGKYSLTVL